MNLNNECWSTIRSLSLSISREREREREREASNAFRFSISKEVSYSLKNVTERHRMSHVTFCDKFFMCVAKYMCLASKTMRALSWKCAHFLGNESARIFLEAKHMLGTGMIGRVNRRTPHWRIRRRTDTNWSSHWRIHRRTDI